MTPAQLACTGRALQPDHSREPDSLPVGSHLPSDSSLAGVFAAAGMTRDG